MLKKIFCKLFGHKNVTTVVGYGYHIKTCARCGRRVKYFNDGRVLVLEK